MATIPGTTTATVGQVLTASFWNTEVRDALDFLLNPPMAAVNRTTNQSITDATDTAVAWPNEDYDLPSGEAAHDTSTNTSRYTVKTAGKFFVFAEATFAGNATGGRDMWIAVNGGATDYFRFRDSAPVSTADTKMVSAGLLTVHLAVNDYIEVIVRQSSGGALNITKGRFGVVRAGI